MGKTIQQKQSYFTLFTSSNNFYGKQNKVNDYGKIYITHTRDKKCIQNFGHENLMEVTMWEKGG
jgi:hypothetical protein